MIPLSFGNARRARARSQAAEITAKVVAERLVAHLKASGFVLIGSRSRSEGAGDNPGARTPRC